MTIPKLIYYYRCGVFVYFAIANVVKPATSLLLVCGCLKDKEDGLDNDRR